MPANYIYEPYTHEQTTPDSTWSIAHYFGRDVNVSVYDDSGNEIFPEIVIIDINTIQLNFFAGGDVINMTGKAVIS